MRLNPATVRTNIVVMDMPAEQWSAFRCKAAKPAVLAFAAMTGAEIARFHLFAALLWAVCTVIAGRRARSEAVHWKVLAWPACAAAGFALVVHMASPDPAEQLVMGALAAVAAFTMLFTAFLPDAADLVANVQMTRPSEPF